VLGGGAGGATAAGGGGGGGGGAASAESKRRGSAEFVGGLTSSLAMKALTSEKEFATALADLDADALDSAEEDDDDAGDVVHMADALKPSDLPPGWTEHFDAASGFPYYCNATVRISLSLSLALSPPPPALPRTHPPPSRPLTRPSPPPQTGETTWEKPLASAGTASPRKANAAGAGRPKRRSTWQSAKSQSGATYFYHGETGETAWDRPQKPLAATAHAAAAQSSELIHTGAEDDDGATEEWNRHVDPASGHSYLHCPATGETKWVETTVTRHIHPATGQVRRRARPRPSEAAPPLLVFPLSLPRADPSPSRRPSRPPVSSLSPSLLPPPPSRRPCDRRPTCTTA
jgi:hypothetical protein